MGQREAADYALWRQRCLRGIWHRRACPGVMEKDLQMRSTYGAPEGWSALEDWPISYRDLEASFFSRG